MVKDKPVTPLPLDEDQIPDKGPVEPLPIRTDQIPIELTSHAPMRPTTTEEDDRTTASQRRVNLVWEFTQTIIAVGVIAVTVYTDMRVALGTSDITANQMAGLMQLNVMTSLIIGFYFNRTNHAAIGGVGKKPSQPYIGR